MTNPGGCAYLVARYPGVTHTFIVGEVRGLRSIGVRVKTASIRRVTDEEILSEVDREEQLRTRALLPSSIAELIGCHARALTRSPRAYLRTLVHALRAAHAGGRPRLWQLFYFGEAVLLWSWLETQGLHHIHVHHANVSADVAMLACSLANAAGAERAWTWSLTIHGPTELLDVTTHKLASKVADAAAVVCTSDFARSQVAALTAPTDLAKVHTVRQGVDLVAFRRSRSDREREGPTEILCVAALSRRKGHAVLLEALAQLIDRGSSVRLTLVGGGSERLALESDAAALGIASAVCFAGPTGHDRIVALYERADVFCLPSFAEGIPTVLMEAMAMELPVVSTTAMGIGELVEHERSGILVSPARPDLIAAALSRLLDDPDLRRRMGREGRRRVERDYNRASAVHALHDVLAPLL